MQELLAHDQDGTPSTSNTKIGESHFPTLELFTQLDEALVKRISVFCLAPICLCIMPPRCFPPSRKGSLFWKQSRRRPRKPPGGFKMLRGIPLPSAN